MARYRYDRDLGCVLPVQDLPNYFEENDKRADFPTPATHMDSQPALRHMCNGKLYDSKSVFRRVTKEHGCVEIGNDYDKKQVLEGQPRRPDSISQHRVDKRRRVEAIKRSLDDHRSGRIKRGEVSQYGER